MTTITINNNEIFPILINIKIINNSFSTTTTILTKITLKIKIIRNKQTIKSK